MTGDDYWGRQPRVIPFRRHEPPSLINRLRHELANLLVELADWVQP